MDKEVLTALLADALSLEEIGRRLGRHPSTVSYWLRRHGLRANGSDRHASRGGLDRDELAGLVAAHMTTRQIAAHFGCSYATVRYWLRVHDLRTTMSARRRTAQDRPHRIDGHCAKHGSVELVLRAEGGYRCVRCRAEQVAEWRRRAKARLVEEFGGRCQLCGYDRCIGALEFHHRDPAAKRFDLGGRGLARSLATLRAEAQKCVLLCSNCHVEVEAGLVAAPD